MAYSFLSPTQSSGEGPNPTTGQASTDQWPQPSNTGAPGVYLTQDAASGLTINLNTGKPFSGTDPNTGVVYKNGQLQHGAGTTPPLATGDPTKDYKPVNISKDPALSGQVDDMLASFKKAADSALQDFSSYKTQFSTDESAARQAASTAENITPTVNALTAATTGYVGNLNASNQAYQNALAQTAAAQRGVVGQELGNLGQYDTAVNNVMAQELAALGPEMARYKLGTGTPTSGGSAEMSILGNQTARVAAPLELQKIQEQQNILANQALPTERNIGAAATQYAGSYLPQVAGQQFSAQSNLPMQVQGLKNQVANMSQANAVAFMQAMQVPLAVQAQVLGVEIGQLSQIAALNGQTNYQGLDYLPGANVTPAMGFNNSLPGYPNFAAPTRGGGRTSPAAAAPAAVPGGSPRAAASAAVPGGSPRAAASSYDDSPGVEYNPYANMPGVEVSARPNIDQLLAGYNTAYQFAGM